LLSILSSVGFSISSEFNCEISDRNTFDFDIQNRAFFAQSDRYDYYQREASAVSGNSAGSGGNAVVRTNDCLEGMFIHSLAEIPLSLLAI
jgi:hypothetical protein